jgi:hypothetical protein
MPRKIKEAEHARPLESTLKSARELNGCDRLLTTKDAADLLRLSTSWLAKARMRGDGPPYVTERMLQRAFNNEEFADFGSGKSDRGPAATRSVSTT